MTAAAITSGMIWRGIAALGNASVGTTAVMVFVAAVTGLLLPTLAYLGVALDGSKVSRERDSLAADLDDDLDAYLETISNSRRDLASVAEISDTLKDKTFPDICNTTQEAVDAIYELLRHRPPPHRRLVGRPPGQDHQDDRPGRGGQHPRVHRDQHPGQPQGQPRPALRPLASADRDRDPAGGLLDRIDALPAHPWGKSRTG